MPPNIDNMDTIPLVDESQVTQVLSPIRPMESLTPSPSLMERAESTLVLGEGVEVSENTGEVATEEAEEEENEQDPIVELPQQHGSEIIEIETDGEIEKTNGVEVEEEKQNNPGEQQTQRLEDSQMLASHVPACPGPAVESPEVKSTSVSEKTDGKDNTGGVADPPEEVGSFVETQLDSETEENEPSKGAFKVWFCWGGFGCCVFCWLG